MEIGHNVWIGDKVTVLSGVRVGHGAVIGAGTTVTKSVPPFAIVAGSPAREIRYRFSPSVIRQMLDLSWWDWDDERIARNRAFFETSISPTDEIDLMSIVVD
ncbi:CatB-related O-acetyltransferase [Qingshengfaniella alkalisoli]|uniref:CatB-related O-acetyltransferase n=1 Tax=Qingshengfaniella alkalisoli TaxID=2599296 RepID=UPI00197CA592|nr:CatB-related O-acetyltransferase [Qingshengfaniella alkalisoli]